MAATGRNLDGGRQHGGFDEIGIRGDGETGRWGDKEMGRQGEPDGIG